MSQQMCTRYNIKISAERDRGWTGGAMVLGNLPVLGRPTNLG